jgi:hypothetical protein
MVRLRGGQVPSLDKQPQPEVNKGGQRHTPLPQPVGVKPSVSVAEAENVKSSLPEPEEEAKTPPSEDGRAPGPGADTDLSPDFEVRTLRIRF